MVALNTQTTSIVESNVCRGEVRVALCSKTNDVGDSEQLCGEEEGVAWCRGAAVRGGCGVEVPAEVRRRGGGSGWICGDCVP